MPPAFSSFSEDYTTTPPASKHTKKHTKRPNRSSLNKRLKNLESLAKSLKTENTFLKDKLETAEARIDASYANQAQVVSYLIEKENKEKENKEKENKEKEKLQGAMWQGESEFGQGVGRGASESSDSATIADDGGLEDEGGWQEGDMPPHSQVVFEQSDDYREWLEKERSRVSNMPKIERPVGGLPWNIEWH